MRRLPLFGWLLLFFLLLLCFTHSTCAVCRCWYCCCCCMLDDGLHWFGLFLAGCRSHSWYVFATAYTRSLFVPHILFFLFLFNNFVFFFFFLWWVLNQKRGKKKHSNALYAICNLFYCVYMLPSTHRKMLNQKIIQTIIKCYINMRRGKFWKYSKKKINKFINF